MAGDRIHCQVITLDGVVYDKMVRIVDVPLSNGFIGIMADNEPMLGSVIDGPVKCVHEGGKDYLYVSKGLLEVKDNQVNLLVSIAERAEKIDIIRAQGSLERAQTRLKEKLSETELESARESLARAKARLKAHELYTSQSDVI